MKPSYLFFFFSDFLSRFFRSLFISLPPPLPVSLFHPSCFFFFFVCFSSSVPPLLLFPSTAFLLFSSPLLASPVLLSLSSSVSFLLLLPPSFLFPSPPFLAPHVPLLSITLFLPQTRLSLSLPPLWFFSSFTFVPLFPQIPPPSSLVFPPSLPPCLPPIPPAPCLATPATDGSGRLQKGEKKRIIYFSGVAMIKQRESTGSIEGGKGRGEE